MLEEKYYTCRNDKAFKYMFLNEQNKNLLKKLLEFILKEEIRKITFLPTELTDNSLKIKGKNLDALVETNKKIIGLEMNSNEVDGFRIKNMSYICNNYASHISIGEKYSDDIMILQINFTYGMMHRKEGKDKKSIREYYVQDKEGKRFVNNFKIIEINMDYFMSLWYSKNQKEIEENKFLIMLNLKEEELETLSSDRMVKEYMEKLNSLNKSPVFKKLMTEEQEREMLENTIRYNAEQRGIQEGKMEKQIEIVRKMLEKKIDVDEISEITGLSIEEINKISDNLNK